MNRIIALISLFREDYNHAFVKARVLSVALLVLSAHDTEICVIVLWYSAVPMMFVLS